MQKYEQSSNEQRHYSMKNAKIQKSLFISRRCIPSWNWLEKKKNHNQNAFHLKCFAWCTIFLSLSLSLSLAPSFYRCCVLFAVILRFGIMTPQHLCCAYHLRLPLPKHLFHQMKAIVSLCMLSSISIRNANENACTHFFLFHRNDKMHFNEKLF